MRYGLIAVGLVGVALLGPSRAEACGGFFCSTTPIDQSGERIIFTVRPGQIEAHVQISYTGEASQFSWVVPTEAKPTLSIGSPQFFSAIASVTQASFRLQWTESRCGSRGGIFGPPTAAEFDAAAGGATNKDGDVTVVSQEQIGPYDAAILQANSAEGLTEWLRTNGYVLTPQGADALVPYVNPSFYFVALKLSQDKGTGDLRPIVLTMDSKRPCIPIRLTAIAAQPDMPITAYVFAEHRAVPQNYRHVLINQSKVDWLRGGSNYSAVASAAVDEAGGHAFLTEFAGRVSPLRDRLWQMQQVGRWNTAVLEAIAHPVDFLAEMLRQQLPRDASIQGLLRKYVPLPKALVGKVTEAQFYNRISTYRAEIDADPGRPAFDAKGFAGELHTTIVGPAQHGLEILESFPYLTRLYTTMSAEEMTVDPEFQFNPDVPDVSNVFSAKATPICNVFNPNDMKVRIELEDGRYFIVDSAKGPIVEGPNAERIEQIPASGAPVVLHDNADLITGVLRRAGGGVAVPRGGCSAAAGAPLWLSLVGVLALLRRRRS